MKFQLVDEEVHSDIVWFQVELDGKKNDCIGIIHTKHLEFFMKKDTEPMKRFYLCNLVINNETGQVLKNSFGKIYVKPKE